MSTEYDCDNCGDEIEIAPIVVAMNTYCSPECSATGRESVQEGDR